MNIDVGDELYKSLDELGKKRLTIERNVNNKLLIDYEKTIKSEMLAGTVFLFLLATAGFVLLLTFIAWASDVPFPL